MIQFKTIRYKNILSTGNHFTEFSLNSKGTAIIVGENGSGKSTLIDALTFALYGRAFRDINKPQIINTLNGKELLVELEFDTAGSEFLIRRGIKPNVFEIHRDGKLVEQDKLVKKYDKYLTENILKMDFKTFSQIIVLGSCNYVPFMQLKTAERRVVIEEMLDISVFSTMNAICKEIISEEKDSKSSIETEIRVKQANLDSAHDQNKRLKEISENQRKEIQTEIDECVKEGNRIVSEIKPMQADYDEIYTPAVDRRREIDAELDKVSRIETQLKIKKETLEHNKNFYGKHDQCDKCGQNIDEEFKGSTLAEITKNIKEIDDALEKIKEKENKLLDQEIKIIKVIDECNSQQMIIANLKTELQFEKNRHADLTKRLKALDKVYDSVDTSATEEEIRLYNINLETVTKKLNTLSVCQGLIKDTGIKSQIIKKFIPIFNELVNTYLKQMKFSVEFEIDETFQETLKSRFRDNFSYNNFSEGEKARLDLAILLAWKAIAQKRNSCSTNLLIMDEVFDGSMDADGAEDFLEILDFLKKDNNIICISHTNRDNMDRFDKAYLVKKEKNYSVVREVV